MDERLIRLKQYASLEYSIADEDVRHIVSDISRFAKDHLESAGFPEKAVRAVRTKFRDAGRRSPPWKATSSRVPGRPQDGANGNRRNRWLFDSSHKFYADEVTATLVEIRYYLQLLSMDNAPPLPENSIQESFIWLTDHKVEPNKYLDPIQLIGIDLREFLGNTRLVQSGHLIPLDRGGKHEPSNSFLMLAVSNQLQGDLTLEELLDLMEQILVRHGRHSSTR